MAVGAVIALVLYEIHLPEDPTTTERFLERLIDAFLVASLLYLIFDGPAKAEITNAAAERVSNEWKRLSEEGLWVLLNKDASDDHREMVLEMAQKKTFLGRVDWRITFEDDADDLLALKLDVTSHGESFEPTGTFPHGDAPLLASAGRHRSRYTGLSLRGVKDSRHTDVIEVDDAAINDPDNQLVGRRDDHAITLDMDRLRKDFNKGVLQQGEGFILRNRTKVYRHHRDFFPMWTLWTACDNVVTVINSSSLDLKFTLARLHKLEVFDLVPREAQSIGMLPPGCAFILSWAEVEV